MGLKNKKMRIRKRKTSRRTVPWTPEHMAIVFDYIKRQEGFDFHDNIFDTLSKKLKRTKGSIEGFCRRNGIKVKELKRRKNMSTFGYRQLWDGKNNVQVHRSKMSETVGRPLTGIERVHHVDGDKINNEPLNLFLCKNSSDHVKIHNQLEQVSYQLIRKGVIKFDHSTGTYFINEDAIAIEQYKHSRSKG